MKIEPVIFGRIDGRKMDRIPAKRKHSIDFAFGRVVDCPKPTKGTGARLMAMFYTMRDAMLTVPSGFAKIALSDCACYPE
jgi:hypothetical protein